ncbi:MAG: hypothetical protein VX394_09625, partial [Pseudomonadota bacterium]|nr:hypothetical protein [Pseudomonadota bacterium]
RGDMARIIDHQERQVERHQVALHLGRHANVEDLHAFDAEAVILATGAAPRPPELDAAADAPLISGRDYMASGGLASGLGGGTVMLIDQDQTAATYGLADQLAQDFEKLIIVTPRPHFAQAVNYCSAIGVYRRLYQANVELVPAMRATAFRDGEVTLENAYGGPGRQLGGIDAVVYVTPRRVVASDIAAAAEGPWTLQRVGDCRSPRNLMAAIHGGHYAAMAL